MYAILLLLLLATPYDSLADVYTCPGIDGETYTKQPQKPDCRLSEIQPPALVYEQQLSGAGFTARGSGPWQQGSEEAQAKICGLYREWSNLGRKRYANAYDFPPHGLTPQELHRLHNLDLLFSHRGSPNCDKE